jgi:outer membrane protein assembly factor BamB
MKKTRFLLLLAAALLLPAQARAGKLLFEKELDSEIRFHLVHDLGIIIAGTSQTIYGFDPETGAEKWKIEKLMKDYDIDSVKPLPGLPFLIYQVKEGMIKPPVIRCLDVLTGQVVWEMSGAVPEASAQRILQKMPKDPPEFAPGNLAGVTADPERGQLLIGTAMASDKNPAIPTLWQGKAGKSKPQMLDKGAVVGVNIETGQINFLYALPDEPSYLEAPPAIIGDLAVLDWAGLHAFKVTDGAPVAGLALDRALKGGRIGKKKALSNTNAMTQVENGIAYVVAGDRVVAVEIGTGAIKWQSPELGTALPELHIAGDKLVVRMGGNYVYYESGKPKFTELTPYGVAILDKATGQVLADTKALDEKSGRKGKKYEITLTTPLRVRDNIVYFATRGSLRAIDLGALDYKYLVPLDVNESQSKIRVGGNPYTPGLKDLVNLDEDVPVQVAMEGDKLFALTTQSTIAFSAADGSVLWWHTIPPPKLDMAMRLAKGLSQLAVQMAALSYNAETGSYGHRSAAQNWNSQLVKDNKLAANLRSTRLQNSEKYGQYNYCLTGETNKPEVMGVSLRTGEADRQVKMDGRGPEYKVDEATGILINVSQQHAKKLQVFDTKN